MPRPLFLQTTMEARMRMTLIVIGSFAATALSPVAAQAAPLSVSECQAIWNSARPKGSNMDAAIAKAYMKDFAAVDTDKNQAVSSDEFFTGCKKGIVHARSDS